MVIPIYFRKDNGEKPTEEKLIELTKRVNKKYDKKVSMVEEFIKVEDDVKVYQKEDNE